MTTTKVTLTDLPDDCLFIYTTWLALVDIICLRITCKRMDGATRARTIWYLIYQRFSRLVPMLPLPAPYTLDALDAVPAHVLEHLSIFAYRLHTHFIQRIPTPSPITSIPWEPNQPSSDELYMLPGGRWLVETALESWRVTVWDLADGHRRKLIHTSLPIKTNVSSSTSAVVILHNQLHVLLHGQIPQEPSSSRTIGHVLSLDLPTELNNSSSQTSQSTVRSLPSLTGFMGPITPVDANGNLMSFHAVEEEELYILDWTYEDPDCDINTPQSEVKGIVLCCFLLGELSPRVSTWTRVLTTKHHNYLLFLTSDGLVSLFLVPSLVVAQADRLPRAQVAPIARFEIPSVHIQDVSAWGAEVPVGDFKNSTYTLSLCTAVKVYTLTFVPSNITQAHGNGYDDARELSSSSLTFVSALLPANADKLHSLFALGPSGTRGIFFERSRYELVLFAGTLPDPSRSSRFHAAAFLGDVTSVARAADADLPNPAFCPRVVFPGFVGGLKRNLSKIAFDECSGRVCLRRSDGSLCIVDFSPMKLEIPC